MTAALITAAIAIACVAIGLRLVARNKAFRRQEDAEHQRQRIYRTTVTRITRAPR